LVEIFKFRGTQGGMLFNLHTEHSRQPADPRISPRLLRYIAVQFFDNRALKFMLLEFRVQSTLTKMELVDKFLVRAKKFSASSEKQYIKV
jgi:hypothetical protein